MLNLYQQTPTRQFQRQVDSHITQETFQESFEAIMWNTITLASVYKQPIKIAKPEFQVPKTLPCSLQQTERSFGTLTFTWHDKPLISRWKIDILKRRKTAFFRGAMSLRFSKSDLLFLFKMAPAPDLEESIEYHYCSQWIKYQPEMGSTFVLSRQDLSII